jgi:hypothetical protein
MAKNNILTTGGTLEYSSTYSFDSAEFGNVDATNYDSTIAQIETTYGASFVELGTFQAMSFTHAVENEQILESDKCGEGEVARFQTRLANISLDFFEVDDVDFFARLIGKDVQTVAGTPVVGSVQTNLTGTWSLTDSGIVLGNTKSSTAVSVTTVTGSTDGLLVLNTDYKVITNAAGYTVVQIIDSATVTTDAQDMVIVYDYTPASSKLIGYNYAQSAVPYMLLKFTTCPDQLGSVNVYYAVKHALASDYEMAFANLGRDGQGYQSTSLSINGVKGGLWLEDKMTLTDY